ncbi:MAG: KH domain-containing protein, partial [Candidatus Thermochlorobacter sp.]
AKEGRMHILKIMKEAIAEPRPTLSKYAPRLTTIQIPVEAIGTVIGKGGETIRNITSQTNTEIDIADDGTITIAATDSESAERAIAIINGLTAEPEEGTVYSGEVKEVRDELGAIVEFLPKITGLLHISEISHKRITKASEALKAGEKVSVKLIRVQQDPKTGKTKYSLSMKALMPPPEGMETCPPAPPQGSSRRPQHSGTRR